MAKAQGIVCRGYARRANGEYKALDALSPEERAALEGWLTKRMGAVEEAYFAQHPERFAAWAGLEGEKQ